jgi:alanyl-tRNA synthetase
MSTTERLYYNDSHLVEFEASVIAVSERAGGVAVTLDRTAFYPTGGGQPSDTGSLGGATVVECVDEGDLGVLHLLQGVPPEMGASVMGRVDWPRRLDHIQQHTGQHILSQAFVSLFGAETLGFRMMEQASEIDVALPAPTDERVELAVSLANRIVWEDRPVQVRMVTPEEAVSLPIRKESTREGELRLIEIDGFDLTPCGGTHACRTGEVGIIAVRTWERARGMTRIEFIAGGRALADYRRANASARRVAAMFSAGRDDAPALVARSIEENKHLWRRVRAMEEVTARVEAEDLIKDAKPGRGGVAIVARVFDERDAESLKKLAQQIVAHRRTVALLGSRGNDSTARLVFARSGDASHDMNALMRKACTVVEGHGGGRPDLAQGGGHNTERVVEAIEGARRELAEDDVTTV